MDKKTTNYYINKKHKYVHKKKIKKKKKVKRYDKYSKFWFKGLLADNPIKNRSVVNEECKIYSKYLK